MRSGRVSAFFSGGRQKQSPPAQQQHQESAQQPVKRGRKLSIDSLMPAWRSSADNKAKQGRQSPSRTTADVAALSITASVTGSHWMKVRGQATSMAGIAKQKHAHSPAAAILLDISLLSCLMMRLRLRR